jgi:hypothetical protein
MAQKEERWRMSEVEVNEPWAGLDEAIKAACKELDAAVNDSSLGSRSQQARLRDDKLGHGQLDVVKLTSESRTTSALQSEI